MNECCWQQRLTEDTARLTMQRDRYREALRRVGDYLDREGDTADRRAVGRIVWSVLDEDAPGRTALWRCSVHQIEGAGVPCCGEAQFGALTPDD